MRNLQGMGETGRKTVGNPNREFKVTGQIFSEWYRGEVRITWQE